jgi:hypothetical protein
MNPITGEVADPEDLEVKDEAPEAEPKPAPRNPRDIALETIAKRAHARRMREQGSLKVDVLEEDGTITANTDPDEPEPEPVQAAGDAPEQPAEATTEEPPPSAPPTAPVTAAARNGN